MALELPDWLTDAFNLIGLPWPGIDEDQLRAWATSIRDFGNSFTDTSSRINQGMRELADSSQSSVITAAARQYEDHHRLIADLHAGALDAFAQALDFAADAVVAQKWIVIGAATALAAEFTATQIGALFTLGADEAALPAEVISTQQIVKFALKELEAVLIGKLINFAATELSDHVSRTIVTLANDAWGVTMEGQGIKIAYEKIHGTARDLNTSADEVEQTATSTGAANAGRGLTDHSGGGGWAEVINAVRQGLIEIAERLFKDLPRAFGQVVRDLSSILEHLAAEFKAADEEGAPAPVASSPRPVPLATTASAATVASAASDNAFHFKPTIAQAPAHPEPAALGFGTPVDRTATPVDTAATPADSTALTDENIAAIKDYSTNDGCKIMNGFLRNRGGYSPEDAATIQARADRVSAGLAKLDPRPGTTWRGVEYSPDVLAKYQVGSVVTEHAFTSSSTDPKVATENFNKNTVITIHGSSGRDIGSISECPWESEILYDKGSRFQVLRNEYDPKLGKNVIEMQEEA